MLVPSPKVATYDLQPEMSAYEVCDKCVERIESGDYDVIILNFANCDMVGHTGVLDAAVKAVETVDTCVGRVVDATLKMGGIAMITADHGNAEDMTQARRQPHDRPHHQSGALYPVRRRQRSCGPAVWRTSPPPFWM